MTETHYSPLEFGWEEWIALPELGLPAIKAKVDTGARTSALHAQNIELFGPRDKRKVRFLVRPVAGDDSFSIACSANVLDEREVTSSNGESERRYVIASTISVAGQSWPIEITLTDRSNMTSRMLLGRQALVDHISISASDRQLQPSLSYDVYRSVGLRKSAPKRSLRIAVLSRENNYSTRRLVQEGESRGHSVEVIDTTRCYMAINARQPEIHYDGARLPYYDAVIPRIGASVTQYGTAVIRQFETIGTFCVNNSSGIVSSRDKLQAHQILASHKIGMPVTAFASSPKDTKNLMDLVGTAPMIVKLLESTQGKGVVLAETKKAAESVIDAFRGLRANFLVQQFVKEASGEDLRCLVIGGRVVAAMKRTGAADDFRSNLHRGGTASVVKISREERTAAVKAAKAFGLGVAGVDLLRAHDGPKVLEVNSSPGLEGIETATAKNIASKIFEHIEANAAPRPTRRKTSATATV